MLVFAFSLVPYKMINPSNALSRLVRFTVDGFSDVPDRFPGIAFRLIARGVNPSKMHIEKETISRVFGSFMATVILLSVFKLAINHSSDEVWQSNSRGAEFFKTLGSPSRVT